MPSERDAPAPPRERAHACPDRGGTPRRRFAWALGKIAENPHLLPNARIPRPKKNTRTIPSGPEEPTRGRGGTERELPIRHDAPRGRGSRLAARGAAAAARPGRGAPHGAPRNSDAGRARRRLQLGRPRLVAHVPLPDGSETRGRRPDGRLAHRPSEIRASPGARLPDLLNPFPAFTQRLDLILLKGRFQIRDARLVGNRRADRAGSGLWPSDHAGIVATLAP